MFYTVVFPSGWKYHELKMWSIRFLKKCDQHLLGLALFYVSMFASVGQIMAWAFHKVSWRSCDWCTEFADRLNYPWSTSIHCPTHTLVSCSFTVVSGQCNGSFPSEISGLAPSDQGSSMTKERISGAKILRAKSCLRFSKNGYFLQFAPHTRRPCLGATVLSISEWIYFKIFFWFFVARFVAERDEFLSNDRGFRSSLCHWWDIHDLMTRYVISLVWRSLVTQEV